jgi:hypothetical protein
MPYFITDQSPECPDWAVVKDDGEVLGCHETKDSAIQQMVAISQAEGIEPGGSYEDDSRAIRELPENYRPALADDVPEGRACGNCRFYDESRVNEDGDKAWCNRWDDFVDGGYYCNAWQGENRAEPDELEVGDFVEWDSSGGMARGQITRIVRDGQINVPDSDFTINGDESDPAALIRVYRQNSEDEYEATDTLVGHRFSTLTKIDPLTRSIRQVNLEPPAYMRAAARQGLKYYSEGQAGDGVVERTIREARALARGSVSADKWVRIRAWIARHLVDLDAPAANPDNEDYPSPGVVAHLLWGSGPSKRAAQRALAYADGVVARLEEENQERSTARGEALSKLETRHIPAELEVRETETGMTFSGYAAVWDAPSAPLPFTERIQRGAFSRSIRSRNDIKMLWNHESGEILGSTRGGTLTLREDDKGLLVSAELPNTSRGRDVAELLRRNDVDSMSFGFTVPKGGDEWSEDGSERTLKSVRLLEVSVVPWPAYEATAGTTSVRGLDRLAKRASIDPDALADAILKIESEQDLDASERELLQKAIDELSPEQVTEEPKADMGLLALKKKKLELLEKGL